MSKFYDQETLDRLRYLEVMILKDFDKVCKENNLTYFGYAGTGIGALRHKGFIPWDDDIDISMPRKDLEKAVAILTEKYPDKYYALNTDTDVNYPLATTRLCLKDTVFLEYPMKDVKCKWGIFLDLYALDNAADNPLLYQLQMWETWFWGKLLILRSIPRPTLYVHGFLAGVVTGACVLTNKIMAAMGVSKERLIRLRDRASRRYENRKTKRIAYFCDPLPYTNTFVLKEMYPLQMLPFGDIDMPFPKNLDALLTKMYGDYMTPPPRNKRKTHKPYRLDFGPYKNIPIEKV